VELQQEGHLHATLQLRRVVATGHPDHQPLRELQVPAVVPTNRSMAA
jgi:hypothetical protein